MKPRFIIFILLLTIGLMSATAQESHNGRRGPKAPRTEETLRQTARSVSQKLSLIPEISQQFEDLYVEYEKGFDEIFRQNQLEGKPGQTLTDAQYRANTQTHFRIARAILDLREDYYKKFAKMLTPKQIDKLYRIEKQHHDSFSKPGKRAARPRHQRTGNK